MKKLLVTLMLSAGLVSVTSAGPLDCYNNNSNPCCINLWSIVAATQPPNTILTNDNHQAGHFDRILTNDGTDGQECKDEASFLVDGVPRGVGIFQWQSWDWADTIVLYSIPPPSANKDKAIITNN